MKIERKKNMFSKYYLVGAGEVFRRITDFPEAPIYLKLNKEIVDQDGEWFDCVNLETGDLQSFPPKEEIEILYNTNFTIWE